jgi:hypothetical protein
MWLILRLTAVIVSAQERTRKTGRIGSNLAEFFAASPLRDSAFQLERVHDSP